MLLGTSHLVEMSPVQDTFTFHTIKDLFISDQETAIFTLDKFSQVAPKVYSLLHRNPILAEGFRQEDSQYTCR